MGDNETKRNETKFLFPEGTDRPPGLAVHVAVSDSVALIKLAFAPGHT